MARKTIVAIIIIVVLSLTASGSIYAFQKEKSEFSDRSTADRPYNHEINCNGESARNRFQDSEDCLMGNNTRNSLKLNEQDEQGRYLEGEENCYSYRHEYHYRYEQQENEPEGNQHKNQNYNQYRKRIDQ
jgi:hypothetical protein